MTSVGTIRPARADDLDAIVRVFLACWHGSYADLLPPDVRDLYTLDTASAIWAQAPLDRMVVAEVPGDSVLGVTRFGPDPDDPLLGHVFSLYVHPHAQGLGLGRRLLTTAAQVSIRDHRRGPHPSAATARLSEVAGPLIVDSHRRARVAMDPGRQYSLCSRAIGEPMATTEKGPHALTRVGPVPLPSDLWDFDPDVDLPNDPYRGVRRAGSRRRLPLVVGLVIVAAASVVWFTMPGGGIDQSSVLAVGGETPPSVAPRDAGATSSASAAPIATRAPIPTPAPISAPTSVPTTQLTGVAPAKVWVGLKNSGDVGTKFDLLAEVYKDGALVTSGHIDNAAGGSSGFNNAVLDTIVFDPFTPIDFPTGSQLTIKLYVRNACTGPTHNSGTARLWYADADANTQFGATIGSTANTYYLLDNFALATTPGPEPWTTMDVAAGAPCSTYKLFGTWTITQ